MKKKINISETTTVSLNYNNTIYQFSTELAKPVKLFYNEVCDYFQIIQIVLCFIIIQK